MHRVELGVVMGESGRKPVIWQFAEILLSGERTEKCPVTTSVGEMKNPDPNSLWRSSLAKTPSGPFWVPASTSTVARLALASICCSLIVGLGVDPELLAAAATPPATATTIIRTRSTERQLADITNKTSVELG